ncbi:MAG: dockerin type I repeat-containing protein [Phycisphaerae bacterium]|nr:dockerin type I repeat-containing protein [Phycisphaerae bacterium]
MTQGRWIQALGLLCAVSIALPSMAMGQATITQDNRKIESFVDCTDSGGTWSWGPTTWTPSALGAAFNETLEYHGISPNAKVDADGIAIQSSSLNGSATFTSVTTSGSADGFADVDYGTANSATVDVESYFWIRFTIDTAQDYTLSGTLAKSSGTGPSVRIRLQLVGGDNILYSTVAGPFSSEGTLQPGTYDLQARATSLYTGSGYYNKQASYENVTFTLGAPLPGDCDSDGDVDLVDYDAFATCLAGPVDTPPSGCDCYDLDGDTRVDLADFAIFQESFGS